MTRSGRSISDLRALLPTVTVGRPPPAGSGSSATTEGTRLEPSTPGITTGWSPSMYATREFVVPRSIPTTRPSAMHSFVLETSRGLTPPWSKNRPAVFAFERAGYVAHEVAEIPPPVEQRNHCLLRSPAGGF